ncbi:unnamed protein product, partial [Nesidiocoris tenuis]
GDILEMLLLEALLFAIGNNRLNGNMADVRQINQDNQSGILTHTHNRNRIQTHNETETKTHNRTRSQTHNKTETQTYNRNRNQTHNKTETETHYRNQSQTPCGTETKTHN